MFLCQWGYPGEYGQTDRMNLLGADNVPTGKQTNQYRVLILWDKLPDSKVHGTNMGPIWGRHDPGWPHELCYLGMYIQIMPQNFAIRRLRDILKRFFLIHIRPIWLDWSLSIESTMSRH